MNETKDELKVMALRERIGVLASQYEENFADLRADATMEVNRLNAEVERLQQENDALRREIDDKTETA